VQEKFDVTLPTTPFLNFNKAILLSLNLKFDCFKIKLLPTEIAFIGSYLFIQLIKSTICILPP